MAVNLIAPGKVFDVVAPVGGFVSGNAYLVGAMLLIALISVPQGGVCSMASDGVYSLPKRSGGAGADIAQGAKVFWDAVNKRIDNTDNAGANQFIGWAYTPAATTSTQVQVKLQG